MFPESVYRLWEETIKKTKDGSNVFYLDWSTKRRKKYSLYEYRERQIALLQLTHQTMLIEFYAARAYKKWKSCYRQEEERRQKGLRIGKCN